MRRAAGFLLLFLFLAARPAAAGPRITLELDGATLDQAFRRLQEKTGLVFRSLWHLAPASLPRPHVLHRSPSDAGQPAR